MQFEIDSPFEYGVRLPTGSCMRSENKMQIFIVLSEDASYHSLSVYYGALGLGCRRE